VLARYQRWERGKPVLRIYKKAMKQFGVEPPIDVWWGGVVGFNKNERTKAFFNLWYSYWEQFGKRRDMPCLACAVANSPSLRVGMMSRGFFAYDMDIEDAVIQHFAGKKFLDKFGIDSWLKQPPPTNVDDFRWISWE
ncbi:MAG: hypothetical protein ACXQTL_07255, partial [Methanosarcinales archaeon]